MSRPNWVPKAVCRRARTRRRVRPRQVPVRARTWLKVYPTLARSRLRQRDGVENDSKEQLMSQVMTKRIGRFDLAESLGEGTFGSYFRGHDPATGRDVAIQTIRLDSRVTPEARDAALRDVRSAAALSHPNIAAIYDIG